MRNVSCASSHALNHAAEEGCQSWHYVLPSEEHEHLVLCQCFIDDFKENISCTDDSQGLKSYCQQAHGGRCNATITVVACRAHARKRYLE